MDFKGRPPLFYAIRYGNYNMVMYLTNQNTGMLLVRDKYGNSPLHIATKYSNYSNEVVKFLLDNGVSSEIKNNKGLTASELASKRIKQIGLLTLLTRNKICLNAKVESSSLTILNN